MSHQTYWLNQLDAEFVISAVEHYDHVTQARAERVTDPTSGEPVYEITVTRHERSTSTSHERGVPFPTLLSALLADAHAARAKGLLSDEDPDSAG